VTAGNHVGVYFHHDDDGVLGSDVTGFTPNVSDVYIVDDVALTSIPEPSAISVLGLTAALLLRRRRH
jgi:hypothetical protein